MNEEIKMSYCAGFLDGDGSFSLIKKHEKKEFSPIYYPLIQLASQSESIIDMFVDTFGGRKKYRKPYIGKDGATRKPSHGWIAEKSTTCKPILERLTPFLVLKKNRANLLLEYIYKNPFKRGPTRITPEILESRENVFLKMRRINDKPETKISARNKVMETNKDPKFWAYMGGLTDSDGALTIRRFKRGKTYAYTPMFLLTMTDSRAINYIMKNIAYGTVHTVKGKTCKNGFCYRFCISASHEIKEFIRLLSPYLHLKKGKAAILQEFLDGYETTAYCRAGVSKDQQKFREDLYQRNLSYEYGVYKPSLIDLEVRKQDDRGEGESHAERLNERASEEDATV